ncbi:MAG: hypothetical protein M3N16_06415 [Actinomycetota bacterium]|nr:hypothetical protein [Actinomycetota bacterium]
MTLPTLPAPISRVAAPVLAALAVLAAALTLAGPAVAYNQSATTIQVSRSFDGGFPNGPSRNPAISQDQRIARVVALESDATNMVPGDTNGATDVFVVDRAGPWEVNGTIWRVGANRLISRGLGGAPANGPSYRPAVDGSPVTPPSCVAFVSAASNLVPRDTNGAPDAFVADLRTGRIQRVSVDSRGRQANGATHEVAVNGTCTRVAFTSDATNLAMTRAVRPNWRSLRTSRPPAGSRQVYVRIISRDRREQALRGVTYLASARGGRAANGNSYQPAFGMSTAIISSKLVFASEATNLARGDRSAASDVYLADASRAQRRFGSRLLAYLKPSVRLVSATGSGRAGNGPSSQPSVTWKADYVAFQTDATDLLPGDTNGVTDVSRAQVGRRSVSQQWISRPGGGAPGNGPSTRPSISNGGVFVFIDSLADNFQVPASFGSDRNRVSDIFLWTTNLRVFIQSLDRVRQRPLDAPSTNPATSARGNYVVYETEDEEADFTFASSHRRPPPRDMPQVVMFYLGPQ